MAYVKLGDLYIPESSSQQRIDNELVIGGSIQSADYEEGGDSGWKLDSQGTVIYNTTIVGSNAFWRLDPGAKPPATPHADDDEFMIANGLFPTGWTSVNLSTSTMEVHGGMLRHEIDKYNDWTTVYSEIYAGIAKAVPAGVDFSIVTRGHSVEDRTNVFRLYAGVGLVWSGLTTPSTMHFLGNSSASYEVTWKRESFGTDYWQGVTASPMGKTSADEVDPWMKLEYTYSTKTVEGFVSRDGYKWLSLGTQVETVHPSHMGLFSRVEVATSAMLAVNTFECFRVNWDADWDPTG